LPYIENFIDKDVHYGKNPFILATFNYALTKKPDYMKTRLLLFSVMVMFSLTSFSQNLEELDKKVEQLTTQVNQLQNKITVLEDKIPYYEEVLKLQQSEPILVNGPYEVRVTKVRYDDANRSLIINGIVKKIKDSQGFQIMDILKPSVVTPEGDIYSTYSVKNRDENFGVNSPEIDIPYAFEMTFEMAHRPQKLALLKFNVGNTASSLPFSYKGITVE
jgi:outer membrane murein-binding lipoprotein Lpp